MQEKKEESLQTEECIIEEKVTKANGDCIIKKYQRGRLLGRGGFAKCYETTNLQTKKVFAAKIIQKSSLTRTRAKQKLISEIKIHKSVNHENIVEFVHVFEDQEYVYILLGLCQNNTLNELLKRRKRLKEIQVQCYLMQIINALIYLHDLKVIHRDLKLGNLFLNDNMQLKLGDFGLATKLDYQGEMKKTVCGTPNYIAPEILESKGHSFEVDIWSVGVIVYTQIIGKPPFQTPQVKSTYKKIKSGVYSFPEHVPITQNAKNFIQKILVLEPSKRPTLSEMLSHPFLSTNTIPKTMPRSTIACPPTSGSYQSIQKKPSTAQVRVAVSQERDNAVIQNPNDRANLRASSRELISSQSNRALVQSTKPVQVYVKKWVDYSTKYGLGYLLTNGQTGVYFNDSTKMIMSADNQFVRYIEKKVDRTQQIVKYRVSQVPSNVRELQKKITLMRHFQAYLEEGGKPQIPASSRTTDGVYYVKKWMKTRYAILFRMSNKIVQVNFTDRTQLILSSQQKLVTYVNKMGIRKQYQLIAAMDSQNQQMTKRLKYTRELLTHMLNGSQPNQETAQPRIDP